jgi:ABC-type multidrug transport system fused ATPase/permease subunit
MAPDFTKAKKAADHIFSILDRQPPIDSSSKEGEKKLIGNGEIFFDQVSFEYPTRTEVKVFKELTLQIKARTTVALVGASGSGKSTAVQLLERFYDPSRGRILIDGVDIKQLNIGEYRKQIGLVSQEPVLFSGTIEENIKYGKPEATMEEVIEAAKMANIHEMIDRLENKYQSRIGNKAIKLSGGEKQRIAIARAMIRKPKILLLDEATSALDSTSEKVVQEALDKVMKQSTTIVIAHRLSTIRQADLIVVLDKGSIVEIGNHDALLEKRGHYAELWALSNMSHEHH